MWPLYALFSAVKLTQINTFFVALGAKYPTYHLGGSHKNRQTV